MYFKRDIAERLAIAVSTSDIPPIELAAGMLADHPAISILFENGKVIMVES